MRFHVTQEIIFQGLACWIEGLADSARHVIGCHVPRDMRVIQTLDDAAINTCQDPTRGDSARVQDALAFRMRRHDVASNICQALMRGDSVPVLAELLPLHGAGGAAVAGSDRHHALSEVARSHEGRVK